MGDIPQEVREAARSFNQAHGGCCDNALSDLLHAMFLAGKRAGMERAAEIAYRTCAETRHVSLGDKCTQAIRSEADGHG